MFTKLKIKRHGENIFLIDFDSTFIQLEAFDKLAEISLKNYTDKDKIISEIETITKLGMDGKIPFSKSLSKRLSLFKINQEHIKKLIPILKKHITSSFAQNKEFIKKYRDRIYIVSGGFKDYIIPIVAPFGIEEKNILANKFIFDKKGNVIGYDKKSLLSKTGGKVKAVQRLKLNGDIYVIGDGYTDYEIKKNSCADYFFAFTENVTREKVVNQADRVVKSLDELLFKLNLPRALSYPKSRMKILLLENIDTFARDSLMAQGYRVEALTHALSEEELSEAIRNVSILGIRSKTQISKRVLSCANKLLAIGAFCIGTNQIDLSECARRGIAVFNAPYSNTRSVVELVIGEIIMLSRGVFDKSSKLHKEVWNKSAKGSTEVRGKKLGIIGYGNIGSQLSVLAEALGMEVYFYDTAEKLVLGNAKRCYSLDELLKIANVISIHVDGRRENTRLIGEKEFNKMKDGAIVINSSRGFVVDIDALAKYIQSGKIRGAAVDVFPNEPKSNDEKFVTPLQGFSNVILTPHIAGSTEEAQKDIAHFVTGKISNFVDTGNTMLSVNFPELQLPEIKNSHRLIHIHKNEAGVLAHINTLFAKHGINIDGQYLGTTPEIGYVITDIKKNYNKKVISELKNVEGTIKLRMLY